MYLELLTTPRAISAASPPPSTSPPSSPVSPLITPSRPCTPTSSSPSTAAPASPPRTPSSRWPSNNTTTVSSASISAEIRRAANRPLHARLPRRQSRGSQSNAPLSQINTVRDGRRAMGAPELGARSHRSCDLRRGGLEGQDCAQGAGGPIISELYPLSNEYALIAEHFSLDRTASCEVARSAVHCIFAGEEEKDRLRGLMWKWMLRTKIPMSLLKWEDKTAVSCIRRTPSREFMLNSCIHRGD
ncbi:hypothetical protein BJ878DRAFT_478019 [Calycina marina]|uniref:Uncharacterized protein n=1 Tax=Calycina marina TaxID=1763456 RepID=A0A9P7Z8A0_9HELO|nr:hypothetical protein BJ878DRAFT_478019 [Calycina marina]